MNKENIQRLADYLETLPSKNFCTTSTVRYDSEIGLICNLAGWAYLFSRRSRHREVIKITDYKGIAKSVEESDALSADYGNDYLNLDTRLKHNARAWLGLPWEDFNNLCKPFKPFIKNSDKHNFKPSPFYSAVTPQQTSKCLRFMINEEFISKEAWCRILLK